MPEPAVPPQSITAADLIRRWRGEAAHWSQMAADTRARASPDYAMAARILFRPPPTAAERAEQEKKLKARIAELERESGIKP